MGRTYAESLNGWQHRLQALAAGGDEVLHLQIKREKLQSIHDSAIIAMRDQNAAAAVKQEFSRRVEALVAEGNKVDTFLCIGLREQYGNRSEKLAEYDIQPFRGRRPAKVVPPPPVEAVK
jgi:hypothetical protein